MACRGRVALPGGSKREKCLGKWTVKVVKREDTRKEQNSLVRRV